MWYFTLVPKMQGMNHSSIKVAVMGAGAVGCYFGGMLALIGPALSLLFTGRSWEQFGLLLSLYAIIVLIDQLALQPWLMKRSARVPIWASIFGPIVLGILIPFWGVLLAPPLLAIIFTFRKPKSHLPGPPQ